MVPHSEEPGVEIHETRRADWYVTLRSQFIVMHVVLILFGVIGLYLLTNSTVSMSIFERIVMWASVFATPLIATCWFNLFRSLYRNKSATRRIKMGVSGVEVIYFDNQERAVFQVKEHKWERSMPKPVSSSTVNWFIRRHLDGDAWIIRLKDGTSFTVPRTDETLAVFSSLLKRTDAPRARQ